MRTRMKMMLGGAATLLGLGAGLWLYAPGQSVVSAASSSRQPPSGASTRAAPLPSSGPLAAASAPAPSTPLASGPDAGDAEWEALATALRERYGARLDEPSVQMRMVEELMRYFQKRNPDRWREELLDFLKKSFPERYEELAALLRNREDYEKWVKDNDAYLRGLGDKERRAALWDARNRLFGKDIAERLWASELKTQALADTLRALDTTEGANLQQKLSAYKQKLQEVHGPAADAYVARHQQELMNRFLDLSSIQRELGAMTPEERSVSLRAVRKEMGLDDEALARWDTLDRTRDTRWDAGARYMAERAALAKEHSGAELETKLQEVRARYFGTEADIIAQEESSGFFRFERPRVWGRN
ncbi:hypothetical protein HPC49_49395 [Pyxidicoccus fallax]|uniref:Lipase modulator n=1 Tax=Pyxidicoccus fallax TaxID=394095 RepID=A0A848LCZ5_9BACT|nr:lipase secretion chaperone [Pyxidicoccus fallax]NMO16304.1 hypothetical protein [Pyxidicoccus fallax]NPC86191.1 hypothetical protein [Pyxidicoccus fallax]